ncbi:MRC1-like protein [Mya arenaria]|uniref:MRC1-like protein n=1 Tax=Mya arenaria TaxID=6604 RepID=A0ABY7EV28_MYAAR|nr:uncharacterized protein LOC128245455 [Mya arenaria]WAR13807.1 MRC1-like protein [Mya arenaria]
MESYLTFEFVFFLTLSVIFIAKGTLLSYTVTQRKCPKKIELGFATMLESKVADDCVEKCALRNHCTFLMYVHRVNICKLYSVDIPSFPEDVTNTVPCIIVKRSDIGPLPGVDVCNCQDWETCDPGSKACRKTECPPPPDMMGRSVLGNLNHNGARIRFSCQAGYHVTNSGKSFTCVDGEWQTPPFTSCDIVTACAVGNKWRTTELGLLLVVANTEVTYDNALMCCHNNVGQLLRVDSLEVKAMLDKEMAGSNDELWLDGRRFDNDVNGFVFSDGTPITETFWLPPEPNEYASCIRRVGEYWRDRDCKYQFGFICQRSKENGGFNIPAA